MTTGTSTHRANERKPYHHGDLRRSLIEAALAQIGEGRVADLSLRGLARRAGVSPGAPYHHFKNKGELLCELATEGFTLMQLEMDRQVAALPSVARPMDELNAIGCAYIVFAASNPAHFKVMFERSDTSPEEHPAMHEAADACFSRVLDAVRRTKRLNASGEQVRNIALTLWFAVHGAARLWVDGPLRRRLPDATTETVSAIVSDTMRPILASRLPARPRKITDSANPPSRRSARKGVGPR